MRLFCKILIKLGFKKKKNQKMNFLIVLNNYQSPILHLSIMILLALYKYLATVYIVKNIITILSLRILLLFQAIKKLLKATGNI